jgi:hypothetical protein
MYVVVLWRNGIKDGIIDTWVYWTLKTKTLSSAVLISCYFDTASCLQWSGSVVLWRSVFQAGQCADKCVSNYCEGIVRISTYFWSTDTAYAGLSHRSTAVRLLWSWVRIPPGAWMFVCCVCFQVEVSATGWSLVQRSPTDFGASLCVIKKPRERGGHSPRWAAEPEKIIMCNVVCRVSVTS